MYLILMSICVEKEEYMPGGDHYRGQILLQILLMPWCSITQLMYVSVQSRKRKIRDDLQLKKI